MPATVAFDRIQTFALDEGWRLDADRLADFDALVEGRETVHSQERVLDALVAAGAEIV